MGIARFNSIKVALPYEAYFTYDVASVGLVPLCVTNEASSKAKANA